MHPTPADAIGPPTLRVSLVDRLSGQPGDSQAPSSGIPFVDSILGNLRVVLNSHEGGTPTRPDFGLPEVRSLACQTVDAAPHYAAEIRRRIETFEPRLRHVRVLHEPSLNRSMSVCFRIDADLASTESKHAMTFYTRVNAHGSVDVN